MKYRLLFLLLAFCHYLSFADNFSDRNPKAVRPSVSNDAQFVMNCHQWDSRVLFMSKFHGGSFFLERTGFTVAMVNPDQLEEFHHAKYDAEHLSFSKMDASAFKISFLNASVSAQVYGLDPYPYRYNYFIGDNPEFWASNVPLFSSVRYDNLYEGIHLHVYQKNGFLKYDFIVEPNAAPSSILLQYSGVKGLNIVDDDLYINNFVSRISDSAPVAFQIDENGDTAFVECHYILKDNVISFDVKAYNPEHILIIDPELVFSSYTGSLADNWGYTATYDRAGNLYGGGVVFGVGYPTTEGAYQIDFDSSATNTTDVSITKFDSSGSFIYYSTYLGGATTDIPHSLYVNDNDELYILGTTGSSDFPTTEGAFDTSFNGGKNKTLSTNLTFPEGSDIFLAKLDVTGSKLLASTFVGGSDNDGLNISKSLRKNYADENRGEILVDDFSNVYVVTSTNSSDFPVTLNSYNTTYNGGQDVCLFKMSQDLSKMIWSSYFGGANDEAGYSIFLCEDHSLYLCGGTTSENLPVSDNAFQTAFAGNVDGFIAHFSENGDKLLNATYMGKDGYDQTYLIKGDRDDIPYVLGQTDAKDRDWVFNAKYSVPNGGQFLTKFKPALDTIFWSTAFGSGKGGPDISPTALLVDYCKSIYLSGWGSAKLNGFGGTSGLPVTEDAFQATTDGSDYYFLCLSDDVSQMIYGSFFGGSALSAREHVDGGTSRFDKKGRIYQAVCAGCGGQSSFPTTQNAFSTTNGSSNCNLGVIKMDFNLPVVVADFDMPSAVCAPDTVKFTNHSQTIGNTTDYFWDFGDGTTSKEYNPVHFYNKSGYYQIMLIVKDLGSCNFSDTLTKPLLVLSNSTDTLPAKSICYGDFVQIGIPPSPDVDYLWSPASSLSNPTLSNPIATPSEGTLYTLIASVEICVDTFRQQVNVEHLQVELSSDTVICLGDTAQLYFQTDGVSYCKSIEWSVSPDFSSVFGANMQRIEVSPQSTTSYYVRVKGEACVFEGKITVKVSSVQLEPLKDIRICFEDGARLTVIHGECEECSYLWRFDDGTTFTEPSPYVLPEKSTSYSVTVTNKYGCSATEYGKIIRRKGTFPTPLEAWCEKCEITILETTKIFATDYGQDYLYQWIPTSTVESPNSPVTEVSPEQTTTYTVIVTDTFDCSMTDTVTIKVKKLECNDTLVFIPNVFSPNGDGNNDVLYVRSLILKEFYFVIYSRWGEKVFETETLDEGWNGTYKNKSCQNGVYDYYFKGKCLDNQDIELKGNIMLVR